MTGYVNILQLTSTLVSNYIMDDNFMTINKAFLLHYNGIIDQKSLMAFVAQYKDGTLCRERRNYNCKKLDRWYHDVRIGKVFADLIDTFVNGNKVNIPIEKYIRYIQYLVSGNRNYCVNHILINIVFPLNICEYNIYTESNGSHQVNFVKNIFSFYSDTNELRNLIVDSYHKVKYSIPSLFDDQYDVYGYMSDDKSSLDNEVAESLTQYNFQIINWFEQFRSEGYEKNENYKNIFVRAKI